MKNMCLDEGILQSYFDGELSPDMMSQVASHIATCAACAAAAREIESESQMLAAAFAPEMSLRVPTERLRERINIAVAEAQLPVAEPVKEPVGGRLRTWLVALAAPLAVMPRQAALGFASLVAVVTLAVILTALNWQEAPPQVSENVAVPSPHATDPAVQGNQATEIASNVSTPTTEEPRPTKPTERKGREVLVVRASGIRPNRLNTLPGRQKVLGAHETEAVKLLPGEQNYLKAIATLKTAIEAGGETAMKPALRVEYERNLAAVDQAIAQTRVAAKRNPNDRDTAEFLYAAYQTKLDLMNTVAARSRSAEY